MKVFTTLWEWMISTNIEEIHVNVILWLIYLDIYMSVSLIPLNSMHLYLALFLPKNLIQYLANTKQMFVESMS